MAERFLSLLRGERRGILPSLARLGLWTLSGPYGLGVRLRNWAFDRRWKKSHAVPVPVISIGNLTVGGTGKTPCVEYIARFYREREQQVAILSRGYGADKGPNDEALVLEHNLPDVPHLQGPDRVGLARVAIEELESEILLLDDGFQHRRLVRDLDLVLIDATNPWGYGYLLPRGLLREPKSGLKRSHAVLLTRCDLVDEATLERIRQEVRRHAPKVVIAESRHRPTCWINSKGETRNLDEEQARPVAAFAGLGNPEGFRETLKRLGREPMAWKVFPDHHNYTREDIEGLRAWARQLPPDAILATTQKDLVKIGLDRLGDRPLWALRIELEVTGHREELERLLEGCLRRLSEE